MKKHDTYSVERGSVSSCQRLIVGQDKAIESRLNFLRPVPFFLFVWLFFPLNSQNYLIMTSCESVLYFWHSHFCCGDHQPINIHQQDSKNTTGEGASYSKDMKQWDTDKARTVRTRQPVLQAATASVSWNAGNIWHLTRSFIPGRQIHAEFKIFDRFSQAPAIRQQLMQQHQTN